MVVTERGSAAILGGGEKASGAVAEEEDCLDVVDKTLIAPPGCLRLSAGLVIDTTRFALSKEVELDSGEEMVW